MDILKRNHVRVFGQGKQAMIFAHGFGCDQNMWRYITPAFQQNYTIVLYDHVGSGQSDISAYQPEKYSSLHGYAIDLLEISQHLGLEKPIFVGHSVGSMIGILSAIQAPNHFDKLILIGPSPAYINSGDYQGGFELEDIQEMLQFMEADYMGWSGMFGPFIMGNPDKPSLGEELTHSFCNTNSDIARHFARVTFLSDHRADLPYLQTPSLLLQCAQDMIAPIEVGTYMHQMMKNAHLVHLKATGHCPHLSAPLETIAAMETFL